MPRPRQINVLADLKILSDECDQIAQDCFRDGNLNDWFDACQQVITKIRDCSSMKDLKKIQYPVSINSFLGNDIKKGSFKAKEVVGVHIEKVHEEKQATIANEVVKGKSLENKEDKKLSAVENHTPCDKINVEAVSCILPKYEEGNKLLSSVENHTPCDKVTVPKGSLTVVKKGRLMPSLVLKNAVSDSVKKYDEKVDASVLSSASKHNSVLLQQITTPVNMDATFVQNDSEGKNMKPQSNFDETFVKNVDENSKTESALTAKTPISNGTLNKIAYGTVIVDSSQKSKILNGINCRGVLTRSGSKKMIAETPENTPLLNRTFKKTADQTVIIESGQESKVLKESTRGVLTRSGSKKKMVTASGNDAGDGKLTRSGSKRKSSGKNSSNKKQKLNVRETPKKTSKAKQPLLKKNPSRSGLLSTPVIVPTVTAQSKTSAVSKEKQILEEIKKKEDKAKSNIKRVLEERQQKAELNKKNLEEKRKKALEKRMQIEKEKEERLRQESQGIKTFKSHVENVVKKIKTRELTENDGKENKSMISNSVKQNETYCVDAAAKTPVTKKSHDSDCYELTPVPESYNFSDDDEEEKSVSKPIPKWATGVPLKSALIEQYYNPIDPIAVFGSCLENPDLAKIFQINKTRYKKRTSSAVWNSSFRC